MTKTKDKALRDYIAAHADIRQLIKREKEGKAVVICGGQNTALNTNKQGKMMKGSTNSREIRHITVCHL